MRERALGLGWLLSMGIGDVQFCFFSFSLADVHHTATKLFWYSPVINLNT